MGSKVQVTNTRQTLEILIPPRGFYPKLTFLIVSAILWNFFVWMFCGQIFASGSWIAVLFFSVPLGVGLWMILGILFTLFGTVRLRITPSEMVLTDEILWLRFLQSRSAPRQNIMEIELTRRSYKKDVDGYDVAVPPQINIWAGTKKFPLCGVVCLTSTELDWLAQILSNWLNLPIT